MKCSAVLVEETFDLEFLLVNAMDFMPM